MLMSIQPPVPATHAGTGSKFRAGFASFAVLGVLVSMPPGPTLISTPSIPQQPQPKSNLQQGSC